VDLPVLTVALVGPDPAVPSPGRSVGTTCNNLLAHQILPTNNDEDNPAMALVRDEYFRRYVLQLNNQAPDQFS
jgi:hypothetical protein